MPIRNELKDSLSINLNPYKCKLHYAGLFTEVVLLIESHIFAYQKSFIEQQ